MIENIQKALVKYWGYDSFLPLQEKAMGCVTSGLDSIVVLPTGGGKSLCFQAPALMMPGLAVSYPRDNINLFRNVISSGLLGTDPLSGAGFGSHSFHSSPPKTFSYNSTDNSNYFQRPA